MKSRSLTKLHATNSAKPGLVYFDDDGTSYIGTDNGRLRRYTEVEAGENINIEERRGVKTISTPDVEVPDFTPPPNTWAIQGMLNINGFNFPANYTYYHTMHSQALGINAPYDHQDMAAFDMEVVYYMFSRNRGTLGPIPTSTAPVEVGVYNHTTTTHHICNDTDFIFNSANDAVYGVPKDSPIIIPAGNLWAFYWKSPAVGHTSANGQVHRSIIFVKEAT